jgi:uncharacterized membrane protein YbhN (UPF0104 family)
MTSTEEIQSIGDNAAAATQQSRRNLITLGSVALLLGAIVIAIIDRETRQLIGDAWQEMIDISPALLLLTFAFKLGQAYFSAVTWRNLLAAAYPERKLPIGFVLGVDQGQDALNLLSPVRAGTWAMLGLFRVAIPGAHAGTLAAVWGVQSLGYAIFAAINYVMLAIFLPKGVEGQSDLWARIRTYGRDRPMLSTLIVLAVLIVLVWIVIRARRQFPEFAANVRQGAIILGSPRRYLQLVLLPSFLSLVCRCGTFGALLAAFDVPVTIATIALATGAHALAGAVRVTPGGVGTTQAIDIVALREYAPASTVTAFSLSEAVMTAIFSFALSIVAMVATFGLSGTLDIVRRRSGTGERLS